METLLAICLGLGLAAACGFRVFVPMLIASLAARAGVLPLTEGFAWISSDAALIAFVLATVAEIGGYYLPWLDNVLDTLSAPAAVVAGVLLAAASVHGMSPMLQWTIAVIAGGGSAGAIKTGLASLRLGSTATTGGAGNPVLSTIEWIGSIAMTLFAIFLPLLAALLAVAMVIVCARLAWRLYRVWRRKPAGASPAQPL